MSREGFYLLTPHAPDCFLADDPDPFVMHDGIEWSRKRNGHAGGGSAFHRFRCNDSGCPAILLVNVVTVSKWLGRGAVERTQE